MSRWRKELKETWVCEALFFLEMGNNCLFDCVAVMVLCVCTVKYHVIVCVHSPLWPWGCCRRVVQMAQGVSWISFGYIIGSGCNLYNSKFLFLNLNTLWGTAPTQFSFSTSSCWGFSFTVSVSAGVREVTQSPSHPDSPLVAAHFLHVSHRTSDNQQVTTRRPLPAARQQPVSERMSLTFDPTKQTAQSAFLWHLSKQRKWNQSQATWL